MVVGSGSALIFLCHHIEYHLLVIIFLITDVFFPAIYFSVISNRRTDKILRNNWDVKSLGINTALCNILFLMFCELFTGLKAFCCMLSVHFVILVLFKSDDIYIASAFWRCLLVCRFPINLSTNFIRNLHILYYRAKKIGVMVRFNLHI